MKLVSAAPANFLVVASSWQLGVRGVVAAVCAYAPVVATQIASAIARLLMRFLPCSNPNLGTSIREARIGHLFIRTPGASCGIATVSTQCDASADRQSSGHQQPRHLNRLCSTPTPGARGAAQERADLAHDQLFGSQGWKQNTAPNRSQMWQRPSAALLRILLGGTTTKPLGPGLIRARHRPSSPIYAVVGRQSPLGSSEETALKHGPPTSGRCQSLYMSWYCACPSPCAPDCAIATLTMTP